MDEQEHLASSEPSESPDSPEPSEYLEPQALGVTSPIAAPGAQQAQRHRRADTVRQALISRGAGWVVAAALAVAVVILSVSVATVSSATGTRSVGAAGSACLDPAGVGPVRLLAPQGVPVQVPARLVVPPGWLLVPPGLGFRSQRLCWSRACGSGSGRVRHERQAVPA